MGSRGFAAELCEGTDDITTQALSKYSMPIGKEENSVHESGLSKTPRLSRSRKLINLQYIEIHSISGFFVDNGDKGLSGTIQRVGYKQT